MADIISILVVLVFVVIVFRKRLAALFRGRTNSDKASVDESASSDDDALPDKEKGNVYINVFAVNAGEFLNVETLSDSIDAKLHKVLDLIYRTYAGDFIGIDVVTEGDLMLFLIRWHT